MSKLRGLDLGSWPVVGGLAVIAVVFGTLNEHFLSAENLTNLALQMAATGTISLGLILVILLGEIDLSAGSVSGLCAVVMTILSVRHGWNPVVAIVVALAAAALIGALHGWMFTQLRMPSFVVTLAGLIGWQGLMLYLLGRGGTINLPFDGPVAMLSDTWFAPWAGWLLVALIVGIRTGSALLERRLRHAAELPVTPARWLVLKLVGLAVALGAACLVFSADRG